jgi:hypothetical protein
MSMTALKKNATTTTMQPNAIEARLLCPNQVTPNVEFGRAQACECCLLLQPRLYGCRSDSRSNLGSASQARPRALAGRLRHTATLVRPGADGAAASLCRKLFERGALGFVSR